MINPLSFLFICIYKRHYLLVGQKCPAIIIKLWRVVSDPLGMIRSKFKRKKIKSESKSTYRFFMRTA
jgi:hypothetical protein